MARPDQVENWTNVVAGSGGVIALTGVVLPWATRTTVVYGEDGAVGIRAWTALPFVTVVVVVAATSIVAVAGVRVARSPRPIWASAVLFVASGGLVVLSVIAWTVTVLARGGPAVVVEGFEQSRTLPSLGAVLVVLGGLMGTTAGVVARTDDQLGRSPVSTQLN